MSEENNIELRSEEFQEVLSDIPPRILRWGITVIAIIVVLFLAGSAIIKYPDVIPARMVLTGSVPPAAVAARASGKLNELPVQDNQAVKTGDYLAVIDNPARTADVLKLKAFLNGFMGNDAINNLSALPPQNLQLGNLQTAYSNFYITLFNCMEYNRLLYYPEKVKITKERITQYEEQFQNLQRQQKLMKVQAGDAAYYTVEIALPNKLTTAYRKELPYLPICRGRPISLPRISLCWNVLSCLLRKF